MIAPAFRNRFTTSASSATIEPRSANDPEVVLSPVNGIIINRHD